MARLLMPLQNYERYSSVVVASPPPTKKEATFKVNQTPFKASPRCQTGATNTVEDDNMYSTVSNVRRTELLMTTLTSMQHSIQ